MSADFTDDLDRFDSIFGDLELTPPTGVYTLFVYGTMMEGEYNHHRLQVPGVESLGLCETRDYGFELRSKRAIHGFAPVVVRGGKHRIAGEAYKVPAHVIQELDIFEGHPDVYRREKIILGMRSAGIPDKAWAYIYQGDISNLQPHGVWVCRREPIDPQNRSGPCRDTRGWTNSEGWG